MRQGMLLLLLLESFAGGLVGRNIKNLGGNGIIKACYATGDVTSTSSSDADAYAGGFIGLNGKSDGSSMGTITASYYASEATIRQEKQIQQVRRPS